MTKNLLEVLDNKAEQSYEVMAYWRYVERVTDATTQEDSAYSNFYYSSTLYQKGRMKFK